MLVALLISGCSNSIQNETALELDLEVESSMVDSNSTEELEEWSGEDVSKLLDELAEKNVNNIGYDFSRYMYSEGDDLEDDFNWEIHITTSYGESFAFTNGPLEYRKFYGNGTQYFWEEEGQWYKTEDYNLIEKIMYSAQIRRIINHYVTGIPYYRGGDYFYFHEDDETIYVEFYEENNLQKMRDIPLILGDKMSELGMKINYEDSILLFSMEIDKDTRELRLLEQYLELYIKEANDEYRINYLSDAIIIHSMDNTTVEIPEAILENAISID